MVAARDASLTLPSAVAPAGPGVPWATSLEACSGALSFISMEGGMFSIVCTQTTSKEGSRIMQVAESHEYVATVRPHPSYRFSSLFLFSRVVN